MTPKEKKPLTAIEFREWLQNCVRDARLRALSDEEITHEVLALGGNLIIELKRKWILDSGRKP